MRFDLAVATNRRQTKTGSLARSRLAFVRERDDIRLQTRH
jgi:hypothetical protein